MCGAHYIREFYIVPKMGSQKGKICLEIWLEKFCSRDATLKNKSRVGHTFDFDDNILRAKLKQNPCESSRDLVKSLKTSQTIICCHLEKVVEVCKLGVLVPHNLNEQNKKNHLLITTIPLTRQKLEPFLNRIIISSERWVTY